MKFLILLFLALPIPALASQATDQRHIQQAVEARSFCTDRNEGPQSKTYGRCVNGYLMEHYHWRAVARRDGSLRAVTSYPSGNPAGSIGGSSINDSNNSSNYDPQALH